MTIMYKPRRSRGGAAYCGNCPKFKTILSRRFIHEVIIHEVAAIDNNW